MKTANSIWECFSARLVGIRSMVSIEPRQWRKGMVVILGPYRSGTSLVAGLAKRVGGWAGSSDIRRPNIGNPDGYVEEPRLDAILKEHVSVPEHIVSEEVSEISGDLVEWRISMEDECPENSSFIVAKNPLFCLVIPQIIDAWPDARFVSLTRNRVHSIKSIGDRNWGWTDEEIINAIDTMITQRDGGLPKGSLNIGYDEIVDNPRTGVEGLIQFLGISPSESQKQAAIGAISRNLRRSDKQVGFLRGILELAYAKARAMSRILRN